MREIVTKRENLLPPSMSSVVLHFESAANSKDRRRKVLCFVLSIVPTLDPTLNFGLKISGDTTKEGTFYFGFVYVCVTSETNPH